MRDGTKNKLDFTTLGSICRPLAGRLVQSNDLCCNRSVFFLFCNFGDVISKHRSYRSARNPTAPQSLFHKPVQRRAATQIPTRGRPVKGGTPPRSAGLTGSRAQRRSGGRERYETKAPGLVPVKSTRPLHDPPRGRKTSFIESPFPLLTVCQVVLVFNAAPHQMTPGGRLLSASSRLVTKPGTPSSSAA